MPRKKIVEPKRTRTCIPKSPASQSQVNLAVTAAWRERHPKALIAMSPSMQAMRTITTWGGLDESPLVDITIHCLEDAHAIANGDLTPVKDMLASQLQTLDHLFHVLTRNAHANRSNCHAEPIMKLALRAQGQCARTAEVLGNLVNGITIQRVGQANIAQQQVVQNAPTQKPEGSASARKVCLAQSEVPAHARLAGPGIIEPLASHTPHRERTPSPA